jgi:hypothetical protein
VAYDRSDALKNKIGATAPYGNMNVDDAVSPAMHTMKYGVDDI